MKLADLGLKAKPETHYVANGYVWFSTLKGELFFHVVSVTKERSAALISGVVRDKEQLNQLLTAKQLTEVVN